MAKSRSIGGIYAELSLKDLKFRNGLKSAQASLGNFASSAAATGAKFAAVGAAAVGAGIVAGIGKSITAAADMETLQTAFEPLLGSADAAEKRMKELSQFAAATPFELPEIAAASKILETLTKGALSTGEGLEMVGDIASATNRPFDEIAVSVGRLYDGLDSGRPVGEALSRLQELGAISGDTRAEIEKLQKEGKKGAEVWGIAESALSRFSGSMEKQSATWNGKISTLKDNINLAFAAMGQPINDSLKPVLDRLASFDFTEIGDRLGNALADGLEIIMDGKAWELFTLHAEQAFNKIADMGKPGAVLSSITDTIAASVNALTDDSGQSFNDAFNKYADAGIDDRIASTKEIQDRIDAITSEARKKREDRELRSRLGPGKGMTIEMPKPPDWLANGFFDNPAFDMTSGIVNDARKESRDWESSSYQINDMQRRGLGMGGEYVTKEGKEQVTLLQSINAILKKASQTGGALVWD